LEPLPSEPRVSTTACSRPSATDNPAMPEPTTTARAERISTGRSADSIMCSLRRGRNRGFGEIFGSDAHREHALDRLAGPRRDVGVDVDDVLHVAQRIADVLERDALHVRAQVARANELGLPGLGGDVVAHRALG